MNPRSRSAFAFVLLAGLFLAGCSYMDSEVVRTVSFDPSRYQPGETPWQVLLADLGPPDRVGSLCGGMVWLYEDPGVDEIQLGVGMQYEWLRWFKAVYASVDVDRTILLLLFDKDWKLHGGVLRKWEDDFGTEGGLQLVVTVKSMVDTGSLRDAPQEIRWGTGLLAPLPTGLNAQWTSFPQGRGVELRGVPLKIGQHTLEMQ